MIVSQDWSEVHAVTLFCVTEILYRAVDLYMIRSRIGYSPIVDKFPSMERAVRSAIGQPSEVPFSDVPPASHPDLVFDGSSEMSGATPIVSEGSSISHFFQDSGSLNEDETELSRWASVQAGLLRRLSLVTAQYDTGRAVHVAVRAAMTIATILSCRQPSA